MIKGDKMIKYSIYTENKNIKKIKKLLNNQPIIKGYTIINTLGNWQGIQEKSIIIIIMLPEKNPLIKHLCNKIKYLNNQESVLLTEEKIKGNLI